MEAIEFKKRIASVIERAYSGNVTLLGFLDEAEASILKEAMEYQPMIKYVVGGGIKGSDRNRYIIAPEDYNKLELKIVVYKISYNKKFYTLSHRAILGSLMGLGIKRECIGDIVEYKGNWYFATTLEISEFVKSELRYIGKAPIELIKSSDEVENIISYSDKTYFLSSLRIDCAIAAAYNISRNEAQEMIRDGLIFINQINNLNVSQMIKENDIISVRHKGRLKISEVGNTTKSGRIATVISKRI